MKIFLDDERQAPEGWVQCRWPEEVIELLQAENIEELSLDHDLGGNPGEGRNGYAVLLWLEEQVVCHGFTPPERIVIHSANASVYEKMSKAIESIQIHSRRHRR